MIADDGAKHATTHGTAHNLHIYTTGIYINKIEYKEKNTSRPLAITSKCQTIIIKRQGSTTHYYMYYINSTCGTSSLYHFLLQCPTTDQSKPK